MIERSMDAPAGLAGQVLDFLEKRHQFLVIAFFACFFIVGLLIFKDYGISWDEHMNRNTGQIVSRYITEGDRELLEYRDRYYGSVFELTLIAAEKLFGLEDTRDIYLMRHLLTFSLFFLGVIFFYRLCRLHFGNWKWGLLGALFLILSPRIFAHSFYNTKDLAFLSVFIIAVYTLIRYLDHKNLIRASIHAFTCAFLIDIRILGLLIPVLTFFFFTADLIQSKSRNKESVLSLAVFSILFFGLTILFWPILWEGPIEHFLRAFQQMSQYPWEGMALYMGSFLRGAELPWHYLFVWIGMTTPVLFLLLFVLGCFSAAGRLFQNSQKIVY